VLCCVAGLVRYGVAPDHPEVKAVINTFDEVRPNTDNTCVVLFTIQCVMQVARSPRFRYFGNVNFGTDISVVEALAHYSAVVLACGASNDRVLEVCSRCHASTCVSH
jgi:adrenodoxin-NADP+ reductase